LVADGNNVEGGSLEIPITVTQDAPSSYQVPILESDSKKRELIEEPSIRVSLYQANKSVKFKSKFPYKIYSGNALRGLLEADETAIMDYRKGVYYFISTKKEFNSDEHIRLVPFDNKSYFTILDYSRTVSWKGGTNFDAYRGIMEYKYSPRKDAPYVVNELPLDQYVAGIGETTNVDAIEYIKAILVAARSYGYYQINNGLPKDQRTFDVYGSTIDQLYLGYNSELIGSNIVKAAKQTHGEMVTYNNEPVTTPYFGNSDGMTRTWKQVWGGADKPWLQSVVAYYDKGRSMFGHGVGMSARDASYRASEDKWDYKKILKYYYTGVEVERIY